MRAIFGKTAMMCFGMLICLHMLGMDAVAGEEAPAEWRSTYDVVMLWVNFAILAFVVVKFGRKPLMDFLRGQRNEVAQEIRQVEDEKEDITKRIEETFKTLNESEKRFENLKQRIIAQGEKRKQEILEDSKRQSQMMLDTAKQKVENQIRQAKSSFRAELVDAAITLATEKLPKEVGPGDDEKLLKEYLSGTLTTS